LKWEKQEMNEQLLWADLLVGRIGGRRIILMVLGEIGFYYVE
jgi:hypothetical protein